MLPNKETMAIAREFYVCTMYEFAACVNAFMMLVALCALAGPFNSSVVVLAIVSAIGYWFFNKKTNECLNAL